MHYTKTRKFQKSSIYNYIPTKYDRRGVLFTLYLDHNGYRQLLLSQRTIFRPEISLKSILRRQRYKPKPRTIFYFGF